MARTKTVLGVVAVMAAMLVAFTAPAMADDRDDWEWNDRHPDDDGCWFVGGWGCGGVLGASPAPAMADDRDDWEWNDRHHDDDVCWFLGVWVCDDNDRDRF